MKSKITVTRSEMLSIVRHWYGEECPDIFQTFDGLDLEEVIEREETISEENLNVFIPVEIATGSGKFSGVTKNTPLKDSGISTRALNGLMHSGHFDDILGKWGSNVKARDLKVKHLKRLRRFDIKSMRHIGEKSIVEVDELCSHVGIKIKR